MPSFRARRLDTAGQRGLLLILVEQEAATPHLLTRSGAIYARNPGSSDPVPIADQRRLLDLTARGERAAAAATEGARSALDLRLNVDRQIGGEVVEMFAVAATGTGADFEPRLFAPESPDLLSRTMSYPLFPDWVNSVVVMRDGQVCTYRILLPEPGREEARDDVTVGTLRARFEDNLRSVREVLAELGAHGDLRLAYRLNLGGRQLHIERVGGFRDMGHTPTVEVWTTFGDDTATDRVFSEIERAAGVGP